MDSKKIMLGLLVTLTLLVVGNYIFFNTITGMITKPFFSIVTNYENLVDTVLFIELFVFPSILLICHVIKNNILTNIALGLLIGAEVFWTYLLFHMYSVAHMLIHQGHLNSMI